MKEEFGGAMLLHLMAFFMVIYIAFLTAMYMYIQVYKAKNSTIEYIENYSGEHLTMCEIAQHLEYSGYDKMGKYKITKFENENLGKNYYSVSLLLQLSILPNISPLTLSIPITGETKLISDDIIIDSTSGDEYTILGSVTC